MRDPSVFTAVAALARMSRVELGSLAEDFVYYQLRRRGIDVYRPSYSKETIDFIVLSDGRIIRIQVKATAGDNLEVRLRHTTYENGEYRRRDYDRGQVDVFIVVDLLHEHVFVVPDASIGDRRSFTLTPDGWLWQFKERYDLILGI